MKKKTKVVLLGFPNVTGAELVDLSGYLRKLSKETEYEFIITNLGKMVTIDKEYLREMLK